MRKLLGILLLWTIPGLAQAGPWLRDTGAGYAEFSVGYFQSDGYFRASEETQLNYSSYTLKLYSEVGLPGPFQAIVEMPFVLATNTNASDVAFETTAVTADVPKWRHGNICAGGRYDLTIPLYTPVAQQELVRIHVPKLFPNWGRHQ